MPGPERAASSSVALPISAAVGMTPSAEAKKMTVGLACADLERDRDRDERDEQVRPALARREEAQPHWRGSLWGVRLRLFSHWRSTREGA